MRTLTRITTIISITVVMIVCLFFGILSNSIVSDCENLILDNAINDVSVAMADARATTSKVIKTLEYSGAKRKFRLDLIMDLNASTVNSEGGRYDANATQAIFYLSPKEVVRDGLLGVTMELTFNVGATSTPVKMLSNDYRDQIDQKIEIARVNLTETTYSISWQGKFSAGTTLDIPLETASLVIDRTDPTVSFNNNIKDGDFTNKSITVTASDTNFKELWYIEPSGKFANISESTFTISAINGEWQFWAVDKAGNASSIRKFTYDGTIPSISSSISSGEHTNQLVTINVTDTNFQSLYVKAPNGTFTSTTDSSYTITAKNGLWEFYAVDKAGNQSGIFSFTYDNVKPVVSSSVALNGFTNQLVKVIVSDTNFKEMWYKAPNGAYTKASGSSHTITAVNGLWEFYAIDKADNRSDTYKFTYDDIRPVISSSVALNGFTNQLVSSSASDVNFNEFWYKAPNGAYTKASGSSHTITAVNGLWEFYAVDKAGNKSDTYKFTYDDIRPIISSSVALNGFTNQLASSSASDTNFNEFWYKSPSGNFVKASGSSHTITAVNGLWEFYAVDKAGNRSETYKFTFDNVKPVVSSSVALNGFTNQLASSSASDVNFNELWYKVPNGAFAKASGSSHTITAVNGLWEFYAVDKAGNKSDTYKFTFDNVAPSIELKKEGNIALLDNAWVNQGVYINANDINSHVTKVYQKQGNNWIEVDGDYITGTIYYDNRQPNIIYGSREQAVNGIINSENDRIVAKTNWVTVPYDPRIILPTQIDLAYEGCDYWEYTLSTNEIYVFFNQADLIAFVQSKALNYLASKSHNTFTREGEFKVVATDVANNVSEKRFNIKTTLPTIVKAPNGYTNQDIAYKVDDKYTLRTFVKKGNGEWIEQKSSDLTISRGNGDGTYYFKTVDIAGNIVMASVVLDTERPVLSANNQPSGFFTNTTQRVTAMDINYRNLKLKKPGGSFEIINNIYVDISEINGLWEIVAIDKAGNESSSFFVNFDNIKPVVNSSVALNGYTNQLASSSVSDTNFNEFWYKAPNGVFIKASGSSHTITAVNGLWEFYAVDKAGNRSDTYKFTFDNVLPTITSNVVHGGFTNKLVKSIANDINFNEMWYKSPSGDFVKANGSSHTITAVNGLWEFYATDKAGNQSDTYKFTFDNVLPTGTILHLDSTLAGAFHNAGVIFDGADETLLDHIEVKAPNGEWTSFNGTVDSPLEGTYSFRAHDRAGNVSNVYTICIDLTAPILGSEVNNGGFTNKLVTMRTTEEYFLSLFVKEPNGEFVKFDVSNHKIIAINGEWQFYALDKAGNRSETYKFTYDDILPTITSDVLHEGYTNILVNSMANDINFSELWYKSPSGDFVKANGNSQTITAVNGLWEFYALDKAGNQSETYKFTYDDVLPTITSDVAHEGYTNILVNSTANDINFSELWYKSPSGDIVKANGSSQTITAVNGLWEFYATDKAGNQSDTYKFTFDNVLPTGTILHLDSTLAGAFHNAGVIFDGADETLLDHIEVKAPNGEWTSFNGTVDSPLEGAYSFRAHDRAGNVSNVYTICIDLTTPILNVFKNGSIVQSGVYTKEIDELIYNIDDINTLTAFLDDDKIDFIPSPSDLANGEHILYAVDKAGNKSQEFVIIIDKIIPIVTLSVDNEEMMPNNDAFYTNKDISILAEDTSFTFLFVYKDNVLISKSDINSYDISALEENFGIYTIYAEDRAGNRSEEKIVTLQVVTDFGNMNDIYRGYKINAWYDVTLPSYVFSTNPTLPNISGRYSFEDRESAYQWCLKMEELYRVQSQGESWIYVSATNESISQIYTSREDLDKVLAKYASKYVSNRKVSSVNGRDQYNTIKDENGVTNENAFVRQELEIPSYLSDYANLSLLQIKGEFAFSRLTTLLAPSQVSIQYLADDFDTVNGNKLVLMYDNGGVRSQLVEHDMYKQGYYLVKEEDLCGNVEQYLIYIDIETPSIRAEVILGDDTKKELTIDKNSVEDNAGVFYFMSFDILELLDNADNYLAIKIVGRGVDATFIESDTLPLLDKELGGGQYTITIYDRSGNILSFNVNIANKVPTMEYNSLKDTNKQLTLYFKTNDSLNNITSLSIFKVNGVGERVQLETDDLGVPIDFTTLEYNFTIGGKFVAVMTDRYGRTVETAPIFYEKGLPKGNLSVTNNGTTNKDVAFSYTVGNAVAVYTLDDGATNIYKDYMIDYDNINKLYTLTFIANEGLEQQYMIYIYNELNENLFMEYYFGIDTVITNVDIRDEAGAIDKNGYTNKAFSLWWTETGTIIKYTLDNSAQIKMYDRGSSLTANGLYNFTVKDRYGNTEEFSIYLDNIVDYTLSSDSKIINVGGRYLVNKPIIVTVNEAYNTWLVEGHDNIMPGMSIDAEGEYRITIEDRFGNILYLTLVVDMTPPELKLEGVEDGAVTNQDVTITFEEGAKCYLVKNNIVLREVAQGEVFNLHGAYTLKAEDVAGNVSNASFSIDLMVDYDSNIANHQLVTEAVQFKPEEEGTLSITYNGEPIEEMPKYTDVGAYIITFTDSVGNVVEFCFTIYPKDVQTLTIDLYEDNEVVSTVLNGTQVDIPYDDTRKSILLYESGRWAITLRSKATLTEFAMYINVDNIMPTLDVVFNKNNTVSFANLNKSGVEITLTRDGTEIKWTQGIVLKDAGHYVLTMLDDYGNANTIEFDIKYKLNTLSIIMIVIGCIAGAIIIILLIRRRLRIKIS